MSLSNASIVRLTQSTLCLNARQGIQKQHILSRALAIQSIPAPTFDEYQRATYIAGSFRQMGLPRVEIDSLYNVYAWLPAPNPNAPLLLISAHTDTVFPLETNLTTRSSGKRLYGAGIGDNSLGVAALLTLAELFIQHHIPYDANVCFVANTREEGLGNLEGIQRAIAQLAPKAALVIEGMALGRVYCAGIAVRRYKITVTTPGGHSWLHFGSPSAIHALFQFGAILTQLPLPPQYRSTYNIGIVEGGSSVNTIAAQAACYLDLRSEDLATLDQLEQQVYQLAHDHSTPQVKFGVELVGSRPAGGIPHDHPLVQLAVDSHAAIGMTPELESGSTDANALLAQGIPAVCVGIAYGGNAHTLDEYIETEPIEKGMWQLLLLATATANALVAW